MILVTGATGQYGSKVVTHLLNKGINPREISVLVRDASKAINLKEKGIHIKKGNYIDKISMEIAFSGVDHLLLVSSNDRESINNRTLHHKNVIAAAKKVNVKHIVYTSFVRKPGFQNSAIADFQNSHVESENYLKESGIPYTILQNGIYAEMILAFTGNKLFENNTIFFPAKNGQASWVLRDELAEAAANVLITDGHENKTYTLTNTESIGFLTIAGLISRTRSQKIEYISPSIEDYITTMEKEGLPQLYSGMLTMWGTAIAEDSMKKEELTLSTLLKRNPTSVREFIETTYKK